MADETKPDLLTQAGDTANADADKAAADKAAADKAAADKAAANKAAADKAAAKAAAKVAAEEAAAEASRAPVVAVLTTSKVWVGGDQLPRGAVVTATPDRLASLAAKSPSQARPATADETPKDTAGLPFIG
jgi:hypothetical protein